MSATAVNTSKVVDARPSSSHFFILVQFIKHLEHFKFGITRLAIFIREETYLTWWSLIKNQLKLYQNFFFFCILNIKPIFSLKVTSYCCTYLISINSSMDILPFLESIIVFCSFQSALRGGLSCSCDLSY